MPCQELFDQQNNQFKNEIIQKDIIEENWRLAQNYIDYEQNVVNTLTEIFKLNNLI